MDITQLNPLIEDLLTDPSADPRHRAHAGNFRMEERVPPATQSSYQTHHPAEAPDMDAWTRAHRRFVDAEVWINANEGRQPWSYGITNIANRLTGIADDVVICRFEDARFAVEGSGLAPHTLTQHIHDLHHGDATQKGTAEAVLREVAKMWNERRDQRPMFAVSENEIAHLLPTDDAPDDAWGEALRDFLGLGHYTPQPGTAPFELLLMRYTVGEIRALHPDATLLVPTVFDADLSPWFFPSPKSTSPSGQFCVGRSVNLSPLDAGADYEIGCEIIHPPIPYQAHHFQAATVITQPVGLDLDTARSHHLRRLRAVTGRNDFGQDIAA